jgi:pimeloyl-ACP methyl ester carboxylesterase
MWGPVVDKLKNDFTIFTVDYPGFGAAHVPAHTGWTFPLISDEIHQKFSSLMIDQCVVCGISMGGYAALDFTIRYPKSVRGLVLAHTQATADDDKTIEERNKSIRQLRGGNMTDFAESFLSKVFDETRAQRFAPQVEFLRGIIEAQAPAAVINALIAMCARGDSTAQLENIEVPSLIITSSEDFVISEVKSAEMYQDIENSRLEILRDLGHLSAVEDPRQFSDLIRFFTQTIAKTNQGVSYARKFVDQQKDSHLGDRRV